MIDRRLFMKVCSSLPLATCVTPQAEDSLSRITWLAMDAAKKWGWRMTHGFSWKHGYYEGYIASSLSSTPKNPCTTRFVTYVKMRPQYADHINAVMESMFWYEYLFFKCDREKEVTITGKQLSWHWKCRTTKNDAGNVYVSKEVSNSDFRINGATLCGPLEEGFYVPEYRKASVTRYILP